ncbi:MAG: C40 family peptidase [Chitinophagaceae bacterium]|nr:C40 family peptidase [Chitinophagaceae bacterium]
MSYAACCVPVAPVRLEPDHRSEMVSQLLFGECCIITIVEKNGWVKIVNKLDAYTGWCQQSHFQEIDDTQYYVEENDFTADWVNQVDYNGHQMWVPFGSSLTAMKNGNVFWRRNTIHYSGKVWNPVTAKRDAKTIKQLAFKFLNSPYLWGGKSVFGVDCSGFTQSVYKMLNIHLFRDSQQQATQGELVAFLQQAHCGDLAFFDDEEGRIIHVGMLLNSNEIIHSAGKVRVDKIDNEGIVHAETGQRTQRLRIIRRYI